MRFNLAMAMLLWTGLSVLAEDGPIAQLVGLSEVETPAPAEEGPSTLPLPMPSVLPPTEETVVPEEVAPSVVPPEGWQPLVPESVPEGETLPRLVPPNFLGDFQGTYYLSGDRLVPGASQAAFKPADNGSPFPQKALGFSYQYFNNVFQGGSLQREAVTLEKPFKNGFGSVALRLPSYQLSAPFNHGPGGLEESAFGDVTFVLKCRAWHQEGTNNIVTVGFSLTMPSGPSQVPILVERRLNEPVHVHQFSDIHPTVIQFFSGYCREANNWFAQGFTTFAVSTDDRYPTMYFQDVGIGYWLLRNSSWKWLDGVAPMIEAHANVPLFNALDQVIRGEMGAPAVLVANVGVHMYFNRCILWSLGAGAPAFGQRTFDVGAMTNLNFRF